MKDYFYIQNFSKAVTALENSKEEAIREARQLPGALSVLKTELENIAYVVALIDGEIARLDAKNPALADAG